MWWIPSKNNWNCHRSDEFPPQTAGAVWVCILNLATSNNNKTSTSLQNEHHSTLKFYNWYQTKHSLYHSLYMDKKPGFVHGPENWLFLHQKNLDILKIVRHCLVPQEWTGVVLRFYWGLTLIERAYKWFNITWFGSGNKVGSHCEKKLEAMSKWSKKKLK